ncbi:MAG: HD domain-containing protein [Desulfobacteraceae bacterium]|nr:HD domain-containing protein [Desulfobacteraceae bacterium]
MQPIVLREVVESLAVVTDLMSPVLANHHLRVAHLAVRLAEAAGLAREDRHRLLLAALLHDCGALSVAEREEIKRFDSDFVGANGMRRHAETGYLLLRDFGPFARMAATVRHHHRHWKHGRGRTAGPETVPREAFIIHLADRIDVLLDYRADLLMQTDAVTAAIRSGAGPIFDPGLVALFLDLAARESFWLDLEVAARHAVVTGGEGLPPVIIDAAGLEDLARLFSHLVDFRSRFTATHSHGVAASAGKLAELLGMDGEAQAMMKTAGYLHDLGKLAVPREIVDKKGPLTRGETSLLKRHSYYTWWILRRIGGLETITDWAACHHERMNGRGYPFHYDGSQLSTGARAMAVADVFTAMTEDRPYREGMTATSVIRVLTRMADGGVLDGKIVSLLIGNYAEVDRERAAVQQEARHGYERFCSLLAREPAPV